MINSGYHHPRPVVLTATLLSVALHLFLLVWFADLQLLPTAQHQSPSPTIAINLVKDNSEASENTPDNNQSVPNDYNQAVNSGLLMNSSEQESTKTNSPPAETHVQPVPSTSGLSLYSDLSQFAESFDQSYKVTPEHSGSNDVFNPELQQQLDKRAKRQGIKKQFKQMEQVKKDNQYYEFSGAGDTRMVRIDGQCFIKQDKNQLDEFQNPIMLNAGDCSKKKAIEFTPYAPHVKNAEQRYDRR